MAEWLGSAVALHTRVADATPLVLVRPRQIRARAQRVLAAFPGEVLYAVKCNDAPEVLDALVAGGIRGFDVASIGEIRNLRQRFGEHIALAFMHPVKPAPAVREAYFAHGVRRFAFDHPDELARIRAATDGAGDLELVVRIAVSGEGSALPLSGKFGATPEEAVALLRLARPHARSLGLTFHVGSQCTEPASFERAIALAGEIARRAGGIDHLDVGGGFPARYTGSEPAFESFVQAIRRAVQRAGLGHVRLACEPGRLLVADGASVLTRVELRRGHSLFLDDGIYGNLAELRWLGPCFPIRALRDGRVLHGPSADFELFGPTCDSIDSMPGPHRLPEGVRAGDLLEVGMAGAYTWALRTRFNGFPEARRLSVDDPAWYLREDPQVARAA
ncbi:Lysine/ornithine decarboxylase [bacterium HR40]|nr:Lysine/ornithine decarboxylase [bacterium HR40]